MKSMLVNMLMVLVFTVWRVNVASIVPMSNSEVSKASAHQEVSVPKFMCPPGCVPPMKNYKSALFVRIHNPKWPISSTTNPCPYGCVPGF